jgi:hypothetical protein
MSFKCHAGHTSNPRELKTEVVTQWRAKEYPAVELPKKFGDVARRWSTAGVGHEAAVTVSVCPSHLEEARAKAPAPPITGNHRSAGA